ncbi:hypothetical protein, partial [Wenzhouxiangella sp. EGI_FJ10409]|uniref:hypothetical protein n=1 Tax=Wenzhouxiangella sp. EGI_FJ10409 TaxID=3243767 RepID=UPI0035DB2FF1
RQAKGGFENLCAHHSGSNQGPEAMIPTQNSTEAEFASRSRREELDQIANRSALPNVGGVAREILERLEVRCGKQTILLQERPSYQEEP